MRKTPLKLEEIREEARKVVDVTRLQRIHLFPCDYEALERAAKRDDKPGWLLRGSNGKLYIDTIEAVRVPQ